MKHTISAVVMIVALGVSIYGLLAYLNMPSQGIISLLPVSMLAFPSISEWFKEWYKSQPEKEKELAKGKIQSHPLAVSFFVLWYLQLTRILVGAFVGAIIGVTLNLVGINEQEEIFKRSINVIVPPFSISILILAVVPIARYAAYRLKKLPLVWIAGCLFLDRLIAIAVVRIFQPIDLNGELIMNQLNEFFLMLLGAVVGWFWASHSQVEFIMSQLFKKLSPTDRKTLIELVRTLPDQSSRKEATQSEF